MRDEYGMTGIGGAMLELNFGDMSNNVQVYFC